MPRATETFEEIIASAVSQAIAKIGPAIQRRVAELAAEELEKNLAMNGKGTARRAARRARARGADITKWVADNRARRVPKFVIEATGLDTKKKIVAKFGENATFEKGKPLPKAVNGAWCTRSRARFACPRYPRGRHGHHSSGPAWREPRKRRASSIPPRRSAPHTAWVRASGARSGGAQALWDMRSVQLALASRGRDR